MRKWDFFIFILLAFFCEATFLNYFKIFNVAPQLVLSLVVLASLFRQERLALGTAVFAGMLKDLLNIQAFGLNTILFPLWSFAVIRLSKKISLDNNFSRVALVCIIVFLQDSVVNLIDFTLNKSAVSLGLFLRITFLDCLYTSAVLPLLLRIIRPAIS